MGNSNVRRWYIYIYILILKYDFDEIGQREQLLLCLYLSTAIFLPNLTLGPIVKHLWQFWSPIHTVSEYSKTAKSDPLKHQTLEEVCEWLPKCPTNLDPTCQSSLQWPGLVPFLWPTMPLSFRFSCST